MNRNLNARFPGQTARARRTLAVVACLLLSIGGASVPSGGDAAAAVVAPPAQVAVQLDPAAGVTIADVATRTNTTVVDTIAGPPVQYLLQADDARTADQLALALGADPGVVDPHVNGRIDNPEAVNGLVKFHGWAAEPASQATAQYAATLLGLAAANKVSKGAGVTVAVIDTGVQLLPKPHPALAKALVAGTDLVDDDGVPDDARTGAADPATGVVDGMAGHGTHVAGIVHLVAPSARIMPVRALDSTGSGTMWNVVKGMEWAAAHGATVINASLGARGSIGLVRDEAARLTERGIVVVAAAGNDGRDRDNFPAATRCAVSVTASDAADTVADFSTTGTSVSVAAPGVDVTSTHPFSPTGYASWSGSSMASPFAAGTAALIRSVRPSTPGEVLALIAGSARPVSSTFGTVGFGRLDPLAAVSDARANNIPTAAQAGIPEKCLP